MRKIYGPNQADESLEYEIRAIQAEQEFEANNKATYMACFQGTNRKRSLTVAFLYSTANIGGASFLAQNIYFLITAGLEAVHCFDVGIGGFGLAVLIILTSGVYLKYVNRRNVVLIGLVLNLVVMVIIGALYWADKKGGLWAIAVLMSILISLQSSLLQGAGWPIAAEIPSYSLRGRPSPSAFARRHSPPGSSTSSPRTCTMSTLGISEQGQAGSMPGRRCSCSLAVGFGYRILLG